MEVEAVEVKGEAWGKRPSCICFDYSFVYCYSFFFSEILFLLKRGQVDLQLGFVAKNDLEFEVPASTSQVGLQACATKPNFIVWYLEAGFTL